jgi:hypothetical protein
MRRFRVTFVPLILALIAVLAMAALVDDRNTRTWGVVMGLTTVAAIGYGAYQEHLATRAVAVARRRLGGTWFDDIRREVDRARRHEHAVAVAKITVPRHSPVDETARLIEAIRPSGAGRAGPRSADRFWRSGGSVYLLLPETTAAGARTVVTRAIRSDPALADAAWQVASFPEDAITVGALFEALGTRPPRAEELPAPAIDGAAPLDVPVSLGTGASASASPPDDA